jgi:hypothetical protein
MWADVLNHWPYIVGLFIYCLLLVLPIYINIDALASSIIESKYDYLHLVYFYYGISTLCNAAFLYYAVNPYYLILYVVWVLLFGIFNPYTILTTVLPMFYIFLMACLVLIMLCLFKKDILTVLFVFLSTIVFYMALYSFSYAPKFLFLGILAVYSLALFLYFKPSSASGTGTALKTNFFKGLEFLKDFGLYFYNRSVIEKTGIFLLVTGMVLYLYIRDVSKSYYGGQFLVNEPISLDQITTFPIESTYHSSLSCWVYLAPSTDSEYNTIFLFGEKLLVSYEAAINSLRIRLKDDISFIERKILLQKWNHIVFVYDHGQIVLYLNGEVIHASEWSPDAFTNEILFGKIRGKVCHVRYYKNPLEDRFVKSLYDNFKEKNPPIV